MHQNITKNESRDTKQALFVKHLLTGQTITDAAIAVGVSRPTATRWLNLQEVKDALTQGKAEIQKTAHDIIIEKYKEALEPACAVVVEIVQNSEEPAAARLKAVQMIQDRLAPLQGNEQVTPVQEGALPKDLLPYLTNEELEQVERITALAEQRRDQAESDREVLERKRM